MDGSQELITVGAYMLKLLGWLAGRLADEIQVIFEFFKIHYRSK